MCTPLFSMSLTSPASPSASSHSPGSFNASFRGSSSGSSQLSGEGVPQSSVRAPLLLSVYTLSQSNLIHKHKPSTNFRPTTPNLPVYSKPVSFCPTKSSACPSDILQGSSHQKNLNSTLNLSFPCFFFLSPSGAHHYPSCCSAPNLGVILNLNLFSS